MTHTITHATRLAATAAAALLTIGGLAACSNDNEPDSPTSDQTSKNNSNDTDEDGTNDDDAPGTDQSKAVFNAYSPPEPIGTVANGHGLKFEVLKVKDTPNGTLMSFRISGKPGDQVDLAATEWSSYPVLVDNEAGKAYQPVTLTQSAFDGQEEQQICLCTARSVIVNPVAPQHVLYESLPDDLDKVQVRYAKTDWILGHGFDPMTVEVSR